MKSPSILRRAVSRRGFLSGKGAMATLHKVRYFINMRSPEIIVVAPNSEHDSLPNHKQNAMFSTATPSPPARAAETTRTPAIKCTNSEQKDHTPKKRRRVKAEIGEGEGVEKQQEQ